MIEPARAGCIVAPMRSSLAPLALVLAAACTDPTVDVRLVFPAGTLKSAVATYDLTVVVLTDADCEDARYLELSAEDIGRGTRDAVRHQPVGVPAQLVSVPRVDPKLFLLTGYDSTGRVIAGGCTEVTEPIEADRPVDIQIDPALITRVIDSEAVSPSLDLATTDRFELLARERRRDGDAVPQAALRFALRTGVDELRLTAGASGQFAVAPVADADGVFEVTGLTQLPLDERPGAHRPAGPAELVIRGAWSDEVNRIPISIKVAPTLGWLDASRAANQIAPAWTTFPCLGVVEPCIAAAALYQGAAEPPRVVAFRVQWPTPSTPAIERVGGPDLPGARTLVAFGDGDGLRLVTRTSRGWTSLALREGTWIVTTTDEVTTAADQLLAVPPCGAAANRGLLAITGAIAQGYTDTTPAVADSGTPVDRLATTLQGLLTAGEQLELLGAACVQARGAAPQPAIAIRRVRASGELVTLLVSEPEMAPRVIDTDVVGAVTAALLGGVPTVIAASPEGNTLRVQSSRLMLATGTPRMVPDGIISHPVPAAPTALATLDANGDGLDDTVALVPVGADLGVAMTLGGARVDDALSATARLGTPTRGQRLAVLDDPDRQGLVVLGADHLALYDYAPPTTRP